MIVLQADPDEYERKVRISESTVDNGNAPFETASQYDGDMDFEEDRLALERHKAERNNVMFPDEMDTPCDVPARTRSVRSGESRSC